MADLVTLDQVLEHMNMAEPSDTSELELFMSAATAHVAANYGTLPEGTYTETLTVRNDGFGIYQWWLVPFHQPVTAVTSAVDEVGTTYATGFTISADGRRVRHDSVLAGEWTLTYTAGEEVPADLKLAVLEDIRGLYQPGQIGPPVQFGAFGSDAPTDSFRPVNMWPRVDNWIYSRLGPAIA